jgi:hypothetical protein
VAVNTLEYSSPSCPSSVFMQLCPQCMEPMNKVTNFGISGHKRNEEIVSMPNLLCGSDPTTQQIMIKFHWELFEQIKKRILRPELTSNNLSSNTLHVELSSIDEKSLVKNQRDTGDELDYTALYSKVHKKFNYNCFKMPFQVSDKSLFMSDGNSSYFDLNMNMRTLLRSKNWDDVLHKAYAEEGTFELCKTSFSTLTPG